MEKSKKLVLLVLMALMLVVLNSDGQVMAPTLAIIEHEFGVSDAAVGTMMALFTVLGAVVSLLWGYFADKASRKLLYRTSDVHLLSCIRQVGPLRLTTHRALHGFLSLAARAPAWRRISDWRLRT